MQTLEERKVDVEPLFKTESFNKSSDDLLVIILQVKNLNFKGVLRPFDIEILGKKMWEWVSLAVDGNIIKTTTCTEESDILSLIKPLLIHTQYTAVLYSDTPLLQKSTFLEIMDYFKQRQANVLKLSRGYIFNTDYIRNATSINAVQNKFFNEEDFMIATNFKQVAFIEEILKDRILDFHMNNGVFIENTNNISIDADVIIEPGSKIYSNNNIKGQTLIQKNCVLLPGNYIVDSIISSGSTIVQSYIKESRISENLYVGPFEDITQKNI